MAIDLAYLRAAVTDRADVAGSLRVTSAKIDAQINRSLRRLHARVVQESEDEYTNHVDVVTIAGTARVDIAVPLLTLRHVEWVVTEDRVYPLARIQLQERARYMGTSGWHEGSPVGYRLMERKSDGTQRVALFPTPTAVHTVRIYYVVSPAELSLDADVPDVRPGWEEWIIWDAAAVFLASEESDAGPALAMRDAVWNEEIAPAVANFDQARPDRVVDVESAGGGYEEFGA